LASDVIYLHELGFAISFNPAHGISWTDEDAILYERQLDNLAEYYLQQDGKIAPASMFTPNFANLHGAQTSPPKFCGTGTHMVTYDVDGSAYPCHMFAPIVMGQNRSDEIKRIDFTAPENLVDPKCVACPLFPMCPTCYGFNYKYRNHVAIRDLDYCKMYKRQVGAACRFQIDRLARKGIASTRNGMMEAKCLVHAYDVLRELMSAR
jgi:radical SAM protein with 4Fe4S-binding SPASM domain